MQIDWKSFGEQFLYDKHNPLLFNNGFFVYFFLFFILLYYFLRHKIALRRYVFCLFSLYFFYKASGYFVLLVIVSALVDYKIANIIYNQKKKLLKNSWLIASIVFNLGLLFYFKYTNFFIQIVDSFFNRQFNPINIILPVGISFYTFENISYLMDVYRNEFKPAKRFTDYLLFLSFFPKLVMGPIVRAHDFVPQINNEYKISESNFTKGFYLIITGLIKKLIISDYISVNFVDYIFDDPSRYTGIENLFALYGYAIVIYCDFSGYSDMAIGIAKWLGFEIPTNFLSPYQSKNITEFWRRWHISLSSWLRDYLYIPIGGNRNGTVATFLFSTPLLIGIFFLCFSFFKLGFILSLIIFLVITIIFLLPALLQKQTKMALANLNLLATMLLGGLWHGASLNFIIWGGLHGVGLAIHKIWMMIAKNFISKFQHSTWYKTIVVIITFHFVCFAWIFFKAASIADGFNMIHQITSDFSLSVWKDFYANYKNVLWMIIFAYSIHAIPDTTIDKIIAKFKTIPLIVFIATLFLFLFVYMFFKTAEPVMPIYLKF